MGHVIWGFAGLVWSLCGVFDWVCSSLGFLELCLWTKSLPGTTVLLDHLGSALETESLVFLSRALPFISPFFEKFYEV